MPQIWARYSNCTKCIYLFFKISFVILIMTIFLFIFRAFQWIVARRQKYACQPFLMTPYPDSHAGPQNKFNMALTKTRVRIEMTFVILKALFSCLRESGPRLALPKSHSLCCASQYSIHMEGESPSCQPTTPWCCGSHPRPPYWQSCERGYHAEILYAYIIETKNRPFFPFTSLYFSVIFCSPVSRTNKIHLS